MFEYFAFGLQTFEDILWMYFCFPFLVGLGIVLTFRGRMAQVRQFPRALGNFWALLRCRHSVNGRVHPLQAFFACIGGCVGIGNIVAVCTAVQLGGPGALIWLWMTAAIGVILKYAEVYLGLRYRIKDHEGNYRGGPMYYLQQVFRGSWAPVMISVLLCLYGVEVYQFKVVTTSVSSNFGWTKELVVVGLLGLVFYAACGGVSRVGKIAGTTVPLFICIYLAMALAVIWQHADQLSSVLATAFASAFTGHAAVGGFVGSTFLMAVTHGMRRACYSGDLGIGYAAVIHSNSTEESHEKQASLVIVDIFIDSVICTASILLILVTGVWQSGFPQELLVQKALETTFPFTEFFMPVFLFLLGYATLNAYFIVGLSCAEFLGGVKGRRAYFVYACCILTLFAYVDTSLAQTAMAIVGGMLLVFNCYAIFSLRKEISYNFS